MYKQTNFKTYEGEENKGFEEDVFDKMGVFDYADVPEEREAQALPDLVRTFRLLFQTFLTNVPLIYIAYDLCRARRAVRRYQNLRVEGK